MDEIEVMRDRASEAEGELPLVTFALLAYNQEEYVAEAVDGVLSQDYPALQVILSDDGSVDSTFERMRRAADCYDGPHEVVINRNLMNEGIGAHINKLMTMARGEIVIGAAADDISLPNRTRRTVEAFLSNEETVYSVWSRAGYIDEKGNSLQRAFPGNVAGFTDESILRNEFPVIGATHAWRKEVFDFFGPLMDGIVFEDNAISFRSHLLGAVRYVDETLVKYRTHSTNLTNFTKVEDLSALYAAAARRNRWALTGVAQRMRDLEFAVAEGRFQRDDQVMFNELKLLSQKIERRIEAYTAFPSIPWSLSVHALRDPEIAKVFLRSLWYCVS